MCGRYTIKDWRALDAAVRRYFAIPPPPAEPRWNVAPSQTMPVLASNTGGQPEFRPMRWGLVPFWETSVKPKMAPINARAEEAMGKAMFRQSVQKRRCLIPADGFYEWQKIGGDRKQPYHIHLAEMEPFFFAGIHEAATEQRPETYLLFTTLPNALMERIHNRMPAILTGDRAKEWLAPGPVTPEKFAALTAPYPAEQMRASPVSPLVNNPRNDSVDCVASISEPASAPPAEPDLFDPR